MVVSANKRTDKSRQPAIADFGLLRRHRDALCKCAHDIFLCVKVTRLPATSTIINLLGIGGAILQRPKLNQVYGTRRSSGRGRLARA